MRFLGMTPRYSQRNEYGVSLPFNNEDVRA